MRWTRKSIIAEISRLHETGEKLNYSAAENNHLNLVRAAAWHYGTWRQAVESAGVDYESLSRYQRWSKARIIERIRELHNDGKDLSWRAVSTYVDQPLAAAALRPKGFASWREALTAAGIDAESITRYKYWDEAKVIAAIRARKRSGAPMSSKSLQNSDQCLFCAARRRFGSWDAALEAAGFNSEEIRLRRQNTAPKATSQKTAKVATVKTPVKKAAAPKAISEKIANVKVAAKKAKAVSPNGKAKIPIEIVTKAATTKVVPTKTAVAKIPMAKSKSSKLIVVKAVENPLVKKKVATKTVTKKAVEVEKAKVIQPKATAKKTTVKKTPAKHASR